MNYHNITKEDMLNGSGLRVVLWVSGCQQHCPNCHNPQTHDRYSGIEFDEEAEKELFEALKPDYISGLTLSGGHPLEQYNLPQCTRLAIKFKELFPKKNLWVYTGFKWEDVKNYEIMKYIDVLCDGEFKQELANNTSNCKWVGSTNQRVIDVPKTLKYGKIILLDI